MLKTTEEAANYLTLKRQTLYVWRMQGRGPRFLRLGRAIRYRQEDLDEYLREAECRADR